MLVGVSVSVAYGAPEEDVTKLKLTPVGTLLMDGAVYSSDHKSEFPNGLAIPDVRLGVQANYGSWSAKIEAGYAYGRVLLKDMWMQYRIGEGDQIRAGLQMQQFGYQNSTAACMKVTMIEPISNTIFNEPHMIGVQWFHSRDKYFTTVGAHVEPKSSTVLLGKDEMTQQGYGVRSRVVARPVHDEGLMVQAGLSGAFLSPQYNKTPEGDEHDAFTFNANFPTKVVLESAIGATVSEARNLWKLTPELMLCYGRAAVEAQYFFMQINRKHNLGAYRAYGAYGTLRGLILGRDYQYNMGLAGIDTPRKGSLEGVLSYNYTSLSDRSAGILGGRINDVSVGLNYYFNRYFIGKLRYSYSHRWDRAGYEPTNLSGVQVRLQVIF